MVENRSPGGSASRWGPLFGSRALDWAETWEGPAGWGTPVYAYVLDRLDIGVGTRLLDCGCGAGRFAQMAAERGASVAGVDAADGLIAIAAERTPAGEFRVGDIEALPWPDGTFDLVTGFSAFQFADDKARALSEAWRVSRGPVVVVIPSRTAESGLTAVFRDLLPLFPPEALEGMRRSGIFALSEPGMLEEVLRGAGLSVESDEEVECPIHFDDPATAVRAFIGAGPTSLALEHSGEPAVIQAVRDALEPLTDGNGQVTLPGWYRVVIAGAI